METMLTAVHQSQVGYQCARGSRWNMPGPMKRPPPYFDDAKEYISPRSDEAAEGSAPEAHAAEDSAPEAHEPKTPEWEPPKELPPCYEKLKEENGIYIWSSQNKPPEFLSNFLLLPTRQTRRADGTLERVFVALNKQGEESEITIQPSELVSVQKFKQNLLNTGMLFDNRKMTLLHSAPD